MLSVWKVIMKWREFLRNPHPEQRAEVSRITEDLRAQYEEVMLMRAAMQAEEFRERNRDAAIVRSLRRQDPAR